MITLYRIFTIFNYKIKWKKYKNSGILGNRPWLEWKILKNRWNFINQILDWFCLIFLTFLNLNFQFILWPLHNKVRYFRNQERLRLISICFNLKEWLLNWHIIMTLRTKVNLNITQEIKYFQKNRGTDSGIII